MFRFLLCTLLLAAGCQTGQDLLLRPCGPGSSPKKHVTPRPLAIPKAPKPNSIETKLINTVLSAERQHIKLSNENLIFRPMLTSSNRDQNILNFRFYRSNRISWIQGNRIDTIKVVELTYPFRMKLSKQAQGRIIKFLKEEKSIMLDFIKNPQKITWSIEYNGYRHRHRDRGGKYAYGKKDGRTIKYDLEEGAICEPFFIYIDANIHSDFLKFMHEKKSEILLKSIKKGG